MPYVRRQREPDPEPDPNGEVSVGSSSASPPLTSLTVEIPTYLLVVFTPLAIGTVHLWSIAVMLGLAILSFGSLAIRHASHHHGGLKLFPVGLVLMIAAALTLLQILPLPPFFVRILNPGAGDLFDHVLAGTPLWGHGIWAALSLDPPASAVELLKVLAYLMAFLVVVNYYNDRTRARRLLKAVAWTGFGVALIGFFSKLFNAEGLLGFYPNPSETFFFATFVNPNHLAGYLALCAPVAVGLGFSARDRQDKALYGFMGLITGVAVFMTLSRGGIVAFAAACGFMFIFATTRRIKRIVHMAAVQAVVAGVLAVAGYLAYDTIIKEMKTLGDVQALRESDKINAWKGTLEMIKDHPVVGIGRGAFASTYPRYKSVPGEATFTHAENEVLQVLTEWGPAFGLVMVGALLLCFFLGLSRARESFSMGGCLTGLFALGLHNLVDFNLEVAGVALSATVVLGVVSASPFSHAGGPKVWELKFRMSRFAAVGLAPVALIIAAIALPYSSARSLGAETDTLLASAKANPCEPCEPCPLGETTCAMLAHHPADYLGPLVLGKAFLEANPPKLDRAAHWLSRAMYLHPRSPVAHRLAGRALYLAGRPDQALVEYRLAAENDRSILTATVVEVLRLTGDPEAAIQATPIDSDSLMSTARILHNLGKNPAAIAAAKSALDLNSNRVDALDLLAQLWLEAGKLEEAAGAAKQAAEIEPLHDRAYWTLGEVLLRQDKPEKAEETWLNGLDQVLDSTLLAYRLGEFYLANERLKDAEGIARRLQNFAPSDDASQAQLQMLFGRIQERRGLLFDARNSYRLAASLAPSVLPYLYQVGLIEEKMGNWEEATKVYQALIRDRFQAKDIKERIELIEKAKSMEKDQALWQKYVDEPGKDEKGADKKEKKPGAKGGE